MKPVVLVTGASQGIGAAIAQVFARQLRGVRLALVARNGKNLAAVAKACTKLGAKVATFPCDVSDEAAVAALAAAPFADTTVAQFDAIVSANLRSAFLVTRAFLPAMRERGRGDIFFMSSIAGLGAYPNSAAYCAAKFGVTGLAKVLRAETRDVGIRVCCVYPGATWSPSWSGSGVPAERIMPAADVARAFFDVWSLSRNTVVEDIVLRPQLGDL